MAFAANDLKIILFNNWSLAGELSKNVSDNMKEPVSFFSRPQIEGNELTKAIEVQKVESAENENVVTHPKFVTKTDIYYIKIRFRLVNVQDDNYINQLSLVEDMENEVIRIITASFANPSTVLGVFSDTNRQWTILDNFRSGPELIRQLTLRLTGIFSDEPKVFRGFGGTLVFDTSASEGDNKPSSDYLYTEAYNYRISEGFSTIPVLTNDLSRGVGVPELMRGMFAGKFIVTMYLKSDDVDGSDDSKLNKILIPRTSNRDLPTVVFLHAHTNPNSETLTTTSVFKVSDITREETDEGLVTIKLTGDLVQPTVYAIT